MTTYYVSTALGNDGNAGTSEGAGNAWATIGHALSVVAAGDLVYIKADGTYTEDCNITTAGASTSFIVLEGYTTTPGDNGRIDWAGTTRCLTDTPSSVYYHIRNINMTGGSSGCISMAGRMFFQNCRFNGYCSVTINNLFIDCHFFNSSNANIAGNSENRLLGCRSYNPTYTAFDFGAQNITLIGCLAYNLAAGNPAVGCGAGSHVINCTLDGGNVASRGIYLNGTHPGAFVNNVIHDFGDGVYHADVSNLARVTAPVCYNLVTSCTNKYYTGAAEITVASWTTDTDVTGADPNFTDEAGEDYTLTASSGGYGTGIEVTA